MKKRVKKAAPTIQSTAAIMNKDISETIRCSYQDELKVQAQTIQSLKKTLKALASQLSKAISQKRVIKKKKMTMVKKAGLNPQGPMKKQVESAKTEYQAAMDEVKTIQTSIEETRQALRFSKEQMKKLNDIIRSIRKMEKRWDKAIAAKFRKVTKKVTLVKKKKSGRKPSKRRNEEGISDISAHDEVSVEE